MLQGLKNLTDVMLVSEVDTNLITHLPVTLTNLVLPARRFDFSITPDSLFHLTNLETLSMGGLGARLTNDSLFKIGRTFKKVVTLRIQETFDNDPFTFPKEVCDTLFPSLTSLECTCNNTHFIDFIVSVRRTKLRLLDVSKFDYNKKHISLTDMIPILQQCPELTDLGILLTPEVSPQTMELLGSRFFPRLRTMTLAVSESMFITPLLRKIDQPLRSLFFDFHSYYIKSRLVPIASLQHLEIHSRRTWSWADVGVFYPLLETCVVQHKSYSKNEWLKWIHGPEETDGDHEIYEPLVSIE